MIKRFSLSNWRGWLWLVLLIVLALAATRQMAQSFWEEPVIVLEIGGTYESMLEQSTAPFSPLIRGHIWGGIPKTDARLRLVDPQYGFDQVMLILARFRDSRHLDQERYLVTLEVADAWRPFDEREELPDEPHPFPPPQPKKGATPCPSQPS